MAVVRQRDAGFNEWRKVKIMSRYLGPVCRLCRREGMKLFLKGTKCDTAKCTFEKRPTPPGQHGQTRTKLSDYGIQLREKQKLKRMWGMLEQQFKNSFKSAARKKGVTGVTLLQFLEMRLDNIVYRLGFSPSRAGARQLVLHGHIRVNGRKVNRPSYALKVADKIEIVENAKIREGVKESLEKLASRQIPEWLLLNREVFKGEINKIPSREEMTTPVNERLIVELYSK